jgi:hypothetical protein
MIIKRERELTSLKKSDTLTEKWKHLKKSGLQNSARFNGPIT